TRYAPTMNSKVFNAIITRRSMYESTEQFSRYLREAKSQFMSSQDHHQTATWAQEFFDQVVLPSIQDYESQMPEDRLRSRMVWEHMLDGCVSMSST
ncbi:hypothetical protein BGX28_001727, partial [Mortierella sp. GBA30]